MQNFIGNYQLQIFVFVVTGCFFSLLLVLSVVETLMGFTVMTVLFTLCVFLKKHKINFVFWFFFLSFVARASSNNLSLEFIGFYVVVLHLYHLFLDSKSVLIEKLKNVVKNIKEQQANTDGHMVSEFSYFETLERLTVICIGFGLFFPGVFAKFPFLYHPLALISLLAFMVCQLVRILVILTFNPPKEANLAIMGLCINCGGLVMGVLTGGVILGDKALGGHVDPGSAYWVQLTQIMTQGWSAATESELKAGRAFQATYGIAPPLVKDSYRIDLAATLAILNAEVDPLRRETMEFVDPKFVKSTTVEGSIYIDGQKFGTKYVHKGVLYVKGLDGTWYKIPAPAPSYFHDSEGVLKKLPTTPPSWVLVEGKLVKVVDSSDVNPEDPTSKDNGGGKTDSKK